MEYHAFFRLKRRDYAASKLSLPPTASSTQLTRGLASQPGSVFLNLVNLFPIYFPFIFKVWHFWGVFEYHSIDIKHEITLKVTPQGGHDTEYGPAGLQADPQYRERVTTTPSLRT